jgi:hypothetical protein
MPDGPETVYRSTVYSGLRGLIPLMQDSKIHLFLCSSPLQVVHAHMLRSRCPDFTAGDSLLFYEPGISPELIRFESWKQVVALQSGKREFGNAPDHIRENVKEIQRVLEHGQYASVHLVIDSLFWLTNNVVAAMLLNRCRKEGIAFSFSILDEGAVLYTSKEMSWARLLRCWARSAYLTAHGLGTVILTRRSAEYRHRLCGAVYCLHPDLITPPPRVRVVPLRPEWLQSAYGDCFGPFEFPQRSCLYLSQPLYNQLGVSGQTELLLACRDALARRGIKNFYYKAHHFDQPAWLASLEQRCGFRPVSPNGTLPVEVVASQCNADVIFSHFSSALLNLRVYGYRGTIVSYGLERLRGVSLGKRECREYYDVLRRLPHIEIVDPYENPAAMSLSHFPSHPCVYTPSSK